MSQIHELDTFYSDTPGQPLEHGTNRLKTESSHIEYLHGAVYEPEESFNHNQQRFFRIFQESSHFTSLLKPDGTVLEANRILLEFANIGRAEAIAQPLWQIPGWSGSVIDADPPSPLPLDLQQAIAEAATGQTVTCEMQLSGAGDRTMTMALCLQPMQNDTGKVIWLLAEGRDITQRKLAEAEVHALNEDLERRVEWRTLQLEVSNSTKQAALAREQQAREQAEAAKAEIQLYADIVNNIQVGVNVWHLADPADSRSLKLVTSNPIARQMANRPVDEFIGKAILECFPALPLEDLELIARVARSGIPESLPAAHYSDEQVAGIYTYKVFPLPNRCVGLAFENITESKQAEAALQESEQLFATLAELSPVGIFRTDATGRCSYFNPRISEITGFPGVAMLNHGWVQAVHPDDRDRVIRELQESMRAEQVFHTECRFLHPDGQVVWVIGQAFPERLKSGKVMGYVGTITDITDRKRVEQSLRESEHRYANLARMSPVGIFKTDCQGDMLYANERWTDITGLALAEARGGGWRRAMHPLDRDRVTTDWYRYVRVRLPFQAEFRFQRPDGNITWVVCQAVPEVLDNDELVGYVGTITDISDRKQAEQDLESSEHRYATLSKISPVGIFRTDAAGNNTYVNDRWREFTGLSRYEGMGKQWQQAIHPDDRQVVADAWQQMTDHPTSTEVEYRYLRPDGKITWVVCQAVPEFRDNGKLMGYVGTVTDITDRKQTEMELQTRAEELTQVNLLLTRTTTLLEERNRELDQFAYVASHDLKAPLRAIANLSEWIEEDLAGQLPAENQRQMQLLRGRVHRMEELINGLLQYSRVGRTQVSTETVSVQALLSEVIDSLAPPASFTVTVESGMPTLTTKVLLLRQVFSNLIGNAIKHHPGADGQVTISFRDLGSAYEFAVADNGRGIAPEHHEKIFAIFQTLESRDTKESTGIGLSIVKKIVDTEGGSIRVESCLGAGTTFRFTWLKHSG
ncbi:MAG: PAS domain S-box protein [Leptolyngbyaceae cyanobacterium CRU_2_3]|nr:PAS domain S-box protein [Leptolyngbyaceae cyanobacterium CRU_2_3]